MSESTIFDVLKDAPSLLVLVLFMYWSFKQRSETLAIMERMTTAMMDTIKRCCDDESGADD